MLKELSKIRISRWVHPSWRTHALGLLQGFGELLDGIVSIGSLGFFMSNIELTIASYRTKIHLDEMKKARDAKNKR